MESYDDWNDDSMELELIGSGHLYGSDGFNDLMDHNQISPRRPTAMAKANQQFRFVLIYLCFYKTFDDCHSSIDTGWWLF